MIFDECISKAFQAVTGQYTTAIWAVGTNTATWTASEDGLYIVWMSFELSINNEEWKNSYKQFQIQTNNANGYLFSVPIYDDATGTSSCIIRTGCVPLLLKQGNQVYPYIHSNVAGIIYNIKICAVKLSS